LTAYELVTAPTVQPFTVPEIKDALRIIIDDDDAFLTLLIKGCTYAAENFLGRKLISQVWRLHLDGFPEEGCSIELPYGKITAVANVKYYDSDATLQTLDAALYQTDLLSVPGRVAIAAGSIAWPIPQTGRLNSVQVQFTAGYGATAATIPQDIRDAITVMIGYRYINREDQKEIPLLAQDMLWPYRLVNF
jgi:uncharacterized phiE125 gp8 family phage protein